MRTLTSRRRECGMALLMVLLALMLISAVGLGMMYMANTESSVNFNYRDTQVAFFAMRAGLEEMRDRIRPNSTNPIATGLNSLPTAAPPAPNSIVYIINPAAGDNVDPKTYGTSNFFDDEFCHEQWSGLTAKAYSSPCTSSDAPAAGTVQPYITSVEPLVNTAAALKYKWVRLTVKQNATTQPANVAGTTYYVDNTQVASSPVCWDPNAAREIAVTATGYATCQLAKASGFNYQPVYMITTMAITPSGSRRVGQYEVSAVDVTPPPSAVSLDGPNASYSTAHSANFGINGFDNAGSTTWSGPAGACTPTNATVAAVDTGDAAGQANVQSALAKPSGYTGLGGTGASSILDGGNSGQPYSFGSTWTNPALLNQFVNNMANAAQETYPSSGGNCGFVGVNNGCSPTGTVPGCSSGQVGCDANPQITFVNGDFNYGNATGAGILIVTGTLTMKGNGTFDGLILVIGQGTMQMDGTNSINGSLFIAKTNSPTSPYGQLASLGTPTLNVNGGGNGGIQYNSCWANIHTTLHYMIISSREEMY